VAGLESGVMIKQFIRIKMTITIRNHNHYCGQVVLSSA
jgi:hypothetical protein